MANPGESVLLLSEGLALSASGDVNPNQASVLYGDGVARGPSEQPKVGDDVILVSEAVAQGVAAGEGTMGVWSAYNEDADGNEMDGATITIGSNPEIEMNHDGGGDVAGFLRAWNDLELTGDWDLTFYGVSGTRSDPENNLSFGATTASPGSYRYFDSYDGPTVYAINSEEGPDGGSVQNTLTYRENGNETQVDTEIPLGDIRFEKRGGTVEMFKNDSFQGSISVDSNATYHPGAMLENENPEASKSEAVTIDSVEAILNP